MNKYTEGKREFELEGNRRRDVGERERTVRNKNRVMMMMRFLCGGGKPSFFFFFKKKKREKKGKIHAQNHNRRGHKLQDRVELL